MLLVAGCGGDQKLQRDAGARLSASTASRLAAASDAVARALENGNGCLAGNRASKLAASVETATAAGQVPLVLQVELRHRVRALRAAIHCTPPPTAVPSPATTGSTGSESGKHGDEHSSHSRHGEGGKGKTRGEQ